MKKTKIIFIAIFSVLLALVIQLFIGGYIQWHFFGKYEITSANIEQIMDGNGILHVHEIITYKMRKPFRGVYRYVRPERAVEIENVKLWIENAPNERVEFLRKNNREFEARVWVSNTPVTPEQIDTIILHVEYDAKYVFENGQGVAQVFRQFWGDEWDAPAKNITATFVFPSDLNLLSAYPHPTVKFSNENNKIVFNIKKLPPYTFAEARFVFENAALRYAYNNSNLNVNDIENIEKSYKNKVIFSKILPPLTTMLIVALLILIFKYFGKEKEIDYSGIYEREIPFPDTPDIVNAIVVNKLKRIDSDGISAVIMDLYKKKYVELDKKGKYIKIIDKNTEQLNESEKYLYEFLKKYANDNLFSFSDLKKILSRDKKLAKEFLTDFGVYKSIVLDEAKSRKYLSLKGTYLSYVVAVLSILASIFFYYMFSKINFAYQTAFSTILFSIGVILFFLPVDVFGNWSEKGRKYYLKWKNFEKFLLDYSLLSQYPPESVVLWEDYLVYATALGIADKVEKHLKKLVPKEVKVEESVYYYPYRRFGRQFFVVSSVAHSTVSASSSSGGGFSGGAGSVGGGSGGGGGGAF